MSGNQDLAQSTAKEKFEKNEERLNDYNIERGLHKIEAPNDIETYLMLKPEQIRMMSKEDCGEAAYTLNRYALYLQREQNTEEARIVWAEAELALAIVEPLKQITSKYSTYEERKMEVVKQNGHAKKLYDIKVYAQQRLKKIYFIANRVENMSKTLMGIMGAK